MLTLQEIFETNKMICEDKLDVRTITMGISLRDCGNPDLKVFCTNIYDKITKTAENLVRTGEQIEAELGVPIVNKRIAVTPIAIAAESCRTDSYVPVAEAMDAAARTLGINFIGGFSALVEKGYTKGDHILINSIPEALARTNCVCSSINLATTKNGINWDCIEEVGQLIKRTAELTRDRDAIGCAKFVVFANAPGDMPFMAGAFHGVGEGEVTLNVGVSGPGVVRRALERVRGQSMDVVAETIKVAAYKISRIGMLVGREAAERMGVPFGVIDLSLAPTPEPGDSIANILEEMGVESCGAPGTTAALMLLNDNVKKGGAMAALRVGGLNGSFIPFSEDSGMTAAFLRGSLTLEKLEAMTSVCSVGLDMIALPGDTSAATLSAIIADETAIGVKNNKTTAARLIPVPGKGVGDFVEFGGLLGRCPIMPVNTFRPDRLIARKGYTTGPVASLTN